MTVNKPVVDNARKGAVRKRTQLKTTLDGASAWTKRSETSGLGRQEACQKEEGFKSIRKEPVF